jgi:peroxiredoxin
LLIWQRPNGRAWCDVARRCLAVARSAGWRGVTPPLWLLTLALAAGVPPRAAAPYPLLGQVAPDFALHASAGANVRLSEHRGEVVVLSFWSSRCTPCRTQLTALSRSLATYRSAGLEIYGVGVDDDPVQAQNFAQRAGVDFELLLDPAKAVSRDYQIDNLPMTVLIDRSGTVRYALRDYSAASNALYLQQLRALLNE